MLGSVAEAEDIVQEAFLRHQRALRQGVEIDSPKAYLSAVVTRLSIDQLRSARARREVYVGEWLPEPLLTDEDAAVDPAAHAEQADSLSLAFLVLLEQLNPVERAVFLLHDVFAYDYTRSRRRSARARTTAASWRPAHGATSTSRSRASRRRGRSANGSPNASSRRCPAETSTALVELLAADVVVYGDGGGKSPSWPRPIVGRDKASADCSVLWARS